MNEKLRKYIQGQAQPRMSIQSAAPILITVVIHYFAGTVSMSF